MRLMASGRWLGLPYIEGAAMSRPFARRRGKHLDPSGRPGGFVTLACDEGSKPRRARLGPTSGAQMDVQHRSDIRIDHQGIALVLAVAVLVLVLTTAALWVGLR
jgi:hypothetical protein